jgi:menaquinone-dependent protoporphyrinogen oxidase
VVPEELDHMNVLVAYSSRHGATAGIAQRIAQRLTLAGHDAHAVEAREVDDVDGYHAFVVGSAAYMFHWLKDTTRFVDRYRTVLEMHPVWLFSSGPVSTDLVDDKGRDIFEASRPKEFDTVGSSVHPRGERVFFGAWDPDAPAVGLADRFMKLMPAARSSMPVGDFRDWDAIDAWADEIAGDLG